MNNVCIALICRGVKVSATVLRLMNYKGQTGRPLLVSRMWSNLTEDLMKSMKDYRIDRHF